MRNEDLPGARDYRCPVDGRTRKTDQEASALILLGCKRCLAFEEKSCPGPDVVGEAPKPAPLSPSIAATAPDHSGEVTDMVETPAPAPKPRPPLPPFIAELEEMAREAETPAPEPKPAPKRRGRKPKAPPPEPAPPVQATTPTGHDVGECRAAIAALMEDAWGTKDIRTARVDELVGTFREDLIAAKDAGVGWKKLAAVLRRYGYTISENSLKRGLARAGWKGASRDGGKP